MDTSPSETSDNAATRRCIVCGKEHPFTEKFWKKSGTRDPSGQRKLGGNTCRPCLKMGTRTRRAVAMAELRATGHPALQALPTAKEAEKDHEKAQQRARVLAARLAAATSTSGLDVSKMSPTKLSTAVALKQGADVIVREAPRVLELLAHYASDPDSPHHTWALQLFADRILPQRAFAALAIKEAGLEEKGGATPRVTINVIASRPQQEEGRVIEAEVVRSEDAGETDG